MPAKETMHNHLSSSMKKPQPAQMPATSALTQGSPAVGQLRRAQQRPPESSPSLTPSEVLYLQRTAGNQATAALLGRNAALPRSAPMIQAKLEVGPADDRFEREADAISQRVMRAPHSPIHSRLQRAPQVGLKGGQTDDTTERAIRNSRGGSSLPEGVRRKIEPALGADLSNVKVHTGHHAADLNRKLGAKAFTHQNHIFYGAGQSPNDVQLTAHEAVHTVQQGATQVKRQPDAKDINDLAPDRVQRAYKHPDNGKIYSHALPRQEITQSSGVITASATGGFGGGHTIIVLEYEENGAAKNTKVDLSLEGNDISGSSGRSSGGSVRKPGFFSRLFGSLQGTGATTTLSENVTSGSTGSQSSGTGQIKINIQDASINGLNHLAASNQKRSWVVTRSQVNAAIKEANTVKNDLAKDASKYTYKLFGRSFFAKDPLNCARFGERVLQKAGIDASATSWWFGTKLPSTLASGENVGYSPDMNYPQPKSSAPSRPPVQQGNLRQAIPGEFDYITQLLHRNLTFADGKTIPGGFNEFDYDDMPPEIFTFRDDPTEDTDVPTKIFRVLVEKQIGLARLEPVAGIVDFHSFYVKLEDLFSISGALLTA